MTARDVNPPRRRGAPLSRLSSFLAVALVALLAVMIWSGPAFAKQTRAYTGLSFGPDGAGGGESFADVQSVGVDQTSGDVFVYDIVEGGAEGRLYKFSAAGAPIDFSASGENSVAVPPGPTEPGAEQIAIAPGNSPGGTAGYIYVANNATVTVYSPSGAELGTVGEGETCGVAVDPDGQLFIGSFGETIREYTPAANPATDVETGEGTVAINLCNVSADGAGDVYASSYDGATTAQLKGIADPGPSLIEPGGATLAADPVSNELYLDQGSRVSALDPSPAPSYEFGAGKVADSYGVAVYSSTDRVYVSDGGTGTVKAFGPPLSYPTTEPATKVKTETATLNGTVYPEGRQYTDCRFELGLVGAPGFEEFGNCEPEASQIDPNSPSQAVTLSLEGLQPNSDYKFRLRVTNSAGTIEGETLTFSTVGPPRITEILSRDADRESATLEATVDPRGADTSYRIEWGSTSAYGNVATAGTVAAAEGPRTIRASLSGLGPAGTYHYRVVAASVEGGETVSPDQQVETLNDCDLTDGRCLELVSPADKGPIAYPGKRTLGATIQFQAAATGSALAYNVEFGYPDTTAGSPAALYLGRRGSTGWASEQITPPSRDPAAPSSAFQVLSSNLACGLVASPVPLAPGAPATVVEVGGDNLYRRDNTDGSYQLITNLPPVDPPSREEFAHGNGFKYQIIGMSPDCRRVIFRTGFRYPGVPATSAKYQLYEWDDGTLRDIAVIPGSGGNAEPSLAESLPGALDENPGFGSLGGKDPTDYWRAVSADGSRSVFTAVSRFGGDVGRGAVFLRDANDPAVLAGLAPAVDVSQSETATPNDGNSRYWTASTSGDRIFFTARYGLAANGTSVGATSCANAPFGSAPESSGEGCDLYEYDGGAPAGQRLTDLSPDQADSAGAGVVGVLDASEDGSYVYFAARGRLGGAGGTEVENLATSTYNVYLAHAGVTHFVRSIGQPEAAVGESGSASALVNSVTAGRRWTSRSTPGGTMFAFESSSGVPGGVRMVYLYSASDGTTVCVSCRRDGGAPFSAHSLIPLVDAHQTNPNNQTSQPTVLTDNGRLYFYSFDPLAYGAIEGSRNLYQWEHGQVSLIATEPSDAPRNFGNPVGSFLGGASADGADVYFATPESLVGGAEEGWNVYDARVGGGFPEPASPAPRCDPAAEGACNAGGGVPSTGGSPPTSSFGGPGNPPTKHRKKKRHKGKHKRRHKRGHHSRGGGSHRAHQGRRAGK